MRTIPALRLVTGKMTISDELSYTVNHDNKIWPQSGYFNRLYSRKYQTDKLSSKASYLAEKVSEFKKPRSMLIASRCVTIWWNKLKMFMSHKSTIIALLFTKHSEQREK